MRPPRAWEARGGSEGRIDDHINARTGYHAGAVAATVEAKLADKLADIENRARRRDLRNRRGSGFPAKRVRDLKTFFAFTWGDTLPDDDGGKEDFFILACHVARLNGDPERNVRRYVAQWCPWMVADEIDAFVRRMLARPYRWRADTLGQKIGLLDSVRTKLGITSIRPIDVTKAELEQRQREKKNGNALIIAHAHCASSKCPRKARLALSARLSHLTRWHHAKARLKR
jgi:hypothetical protein